MRFALVMVVSAALAGSAAAQFTTPGTAVGTDSNLAPVGVTNSPAGAPVGGQVGSGVGGVAPSMSQDFSKIDKSRLAAPLPTYPGVGGAPSFWDRTKQTVLSAFGVSSGPAMPAPRPTWAPGISRRNRERADQRMWRRD